MPTNSFLILLPMAEISKFFIAEPRPLSQSVITVTPPLSVATSFIILLFLLVLNSYVSHVQCILIIHFLIIENEKKIHIMPCL